MKRLYFCRFILTFLMLFSTLSYLSASCLFSSISSDSSSISSDSSSLSFLSLSYDGGSGLYTDCVSEDRGSVVGDKENPEILRERSFKGKALYGFMNGGSDLYYEYGFVKLDALDVIYKGEEFSVEVYEMDSPENAFGIYSIHAFDFFLRDTVFKYCNFSDYLAQAVIGNYYYSIVYQSPHKGVNEKVVDIINFLFDVSYGNISQEVVIPQIAIDNSNGVTGEIKMMSGPLSIMNGASQLYDYLKGIEEFKVWFFSDKRKEMKNALLVFKNEEDVRFVRDRMPQKQVISEEGNKILFHLY